MVTGCFLIAEAGVNHNGDVDTALRLVDAAARAGADAVKFQTFRAEKLVVAGAPKAEYQARQTGGGDQLSMLKALELSDDAHRALARRCAERKIEFLSTPFDEDAAEMLVGLGMRRIKVPSGELTNKPFLEFLAKFDRPMILSTGMATLAEAREAVVWIGRARKRRKLKAPLARMLTLLHCTSNYPAAPGDVNLHAMTALGKALKLPVGYSDHTEGVCISVAAAALGASLIEKHFTLDRSMPGPDHQASLTPEDLERLVAEVRAVGVALGDGVKAPRPSELPVRDLVRRSLTAARDLVAGEKLLAPDVALLRPGTGLPPKALASVLGRRLKHSLKMGALLKRSDLA